MKEDLISVIISVFNNEKYLDKCINSVLSQTYTNIEIIIVDDGSTDDSKKIADNYAVKDNRIKVVYEENHGPSYAKNKGIELATGKYITFVDGDDFVSEKCIEMLYAKLIETDSDISAIRFALVTENRSVITNVTPKRQDINGGSVAFEGTEIIREMLIEKTLDSYAFGKLYKSELVKDEKFDENTVYEYIEYNLKVFQKAKRIVYIDKESYFHLKHQGSISATCTQKNIENYIDTVIDRYTFIKNNYSLDVYNNVALLREAIAISIKYVIANVFLEHVEDQLIKIFNSLEEYTRNNDIEILQYLNDFQKSALFLIKYNRKLFFDLLVARHNLKWKRSFGDIGITKPKVLLVCDVPNWAFDQIAQQVKKELERFFNMKIEYFNRRTEKDYFFEFIEENKDCDLFHFLNRRILLIMGDEVFKNKVESNGYNYEDYISEIKNKTTCGVYDYFDIDSEGIENNKDIFNKYSKMYYTSTAKLFEIYNSIEEYKKPSAMVHDLCDKSLFLPHNLERYNIENIKGRKIIIGWVGNGNHSGSNEIDIKGLNTILKPVVNELIDEGYSIEGKYADRNDKWRTTDEMIKYYSEIDICVCVSTSEGTPRPVLESMYSGIPLISTDVGIVPEAFGKEQKRFIIGSRENGKNDAEIKKNLKEKIVYLYNHREEFKVLSSENMISIEAFDGGKTIKAFKNFFDEALKA